ncbi:MAG: hypothetical protein B7W98_03360, partial [Parcubacteria group bacterium 20-58-5]
MVTTAGTTTLNGINLWSVGDWAVFDGTAWEKVNGSSSEAFSNITLTALTGLLYGNSTSPLTVATGAQVLSGLSTALGTGVQTALGQAVTGTGSIVLANSPTLVTPALGTPSSATLTHATGLPVSTGISGLGTGVTASLAQIVNTANGFVTQSGADGRYAALAGLSTQVFSVAASTSGTAQAVPRSQADTLYAPVSGSAVYVSSATLAASGGAALVGYSQGTSGSVLRTQASKNQESVSVLDFGADPTGATDSTAAIQDALNSGNSLVWPPGVYISQYLSANTEQNWIALGPVTLKYNGSSGSAIKPLCDFQAKVCIRGDFTFDHNANAGNYIDPTIYGGNLIAGSCILVQGDYSDVGG